MSDIETPRHLRNTRRRVAARLDFLGREHEAAIVRRMTLPELATLHRLETGQ